MVAITILMGVHNGEEFLAETLAGVAAQTFTDYEFVIVDDASTDGTSAMLEDAASKDPRLRVIRNPSNLGLTKSLNVGLQQARGDYVARIDADDVCLPERLAVQHAFLETHPDHVGVCCGFDLIDAQGRKLRRSVEALDDWQVRWTLNFNPPAPHPTFMFRRLAADGSPHLYDESFRTAQDYDFWSRLVRHGKTCVLPDLLLLYRRHAGAITEAKRDQQATNCAITGRRVLADRYPLAVLAALEPLIALFAYEQLADSEAIAQAVAGADAMLVHDLPLAPSNRHRTWLRENVAGVLAASVLSRGGAFGSPKLLARFLWLARRHLPALMKTSLSNPQLVRKVLRERR